MLIKQLISYILISLFLIVMVRPYIPYIEYSIHKNYIEENFCVNKKKPEKDCHGKCYRDKKIKENKEESDSPIPIPFNSIEIFKYIVPQKFFIKNNFVLDFSYVHSPVHGLYDLFIDEPITPPPN